MGLIFQQMNVGPYGSHTLGFLAFHSFTLVTLPPGIGPWRERLVPSSGIRFPLVFVALTYLSDINLKGTSVGQHSSIPPTHPQMKLPFDVL